MSGIQTQSISGDTLIAEVVVNPTIIQSWSRRFSQLLQGIRLKSRSYQQQYTSEEYDIKSVHATTCKHNYA